IKAPDLNTPQAAQNLLAQPSAQQTTAAATPAQSAVQAASKPVPLDGVAVEIAAKANEGTHRFEIRLDPPELGRIEVRLDVDKTGQVVSHITADRGDTLDLLRRDSADLQRALQDAGLKTGDNGLQFSLRDQNANQNNDNNRLADSAQLIARDDNMPAIEPSQIPYRRMSGLPGGVDIRV
ncbi:MAG: flagellar hook-length control protein FliK, partial [Pseudolabrys sp.]|nr:flagellar hook-length control protein FliK [Pseudolabrys sp.]